MYFSLKKTEHVFQFVASSTDSRRKCKQAIGSPCCNPIKNFITINQSRSRHKWCSGGLRSLQHTATSSTMTLTALVIKGISWKKNTNTGVGVNTLPLTINLFLIPELVFIFQYIYCVLFNSWCKQGAPFLIILGEEMAGIIAYLLFTVLQRCISGQSISLQTTPIT